MCAWRTLIAPTVNPPTHAGPLPAPHHLIGTWIPTLGYFPNTISPLVQIRNFPTTWIRAPQSRHPDPGPETPHWRRGGKRVSSTQAVNCIAELQSFFKLFLLRSSRSTRFPAILHSESSVPSEGTENMSSMEQGGGQANEGQAQQEQHQVQQQGAHGANSQLNPQEQAKVASREALEAQQEAQEAIKRAYIKQMAAHEKAEQASQQVVSEQEMAKRVAAQAATEAAEKAANDQKERGSKEMHDREIAQEAARSAVSSFAANQLSNQQGQPTPTYNSGFVPYSSAVHTAPVQPQAVQEVSVPGAVQQGQSQPMNQDNNAMLSAQRCQEMLMQGANQLAQTATAQMTAAQSLAASAPNPETQMAARQQAETAQNQMMLAHQIAAAAQSPDTAVRAAASLFNKA